MIFPYIDQILPVDNWVKNISAENETLKIHAQLDFPIKSIEYILLDTLKKFLNIDSIHLSIEQQITSHDIPLA